MELLERELAKTRYSMITIARSGKVQGHGHRKDILEFDVLNDADQARWHALFRDAGVSTVWTNSDSVGYDIDVDFGLDTSGFVRYIRAPQNKTALRLCEDEYNRLRCGRCRVDLDDGWWTDVRWWARPDREAFEAVLHEEISSEQYQDRYHAALDSCEAASLRIIGYSE